MKQNYSSSAPTSISSSPNSEESKTRNWLDLPRDIMTTILLNLGPVEILNNAQFVCTQWWSITKDPLLWRVIDMTNCFDGPSFMYLDFRKICRHAIDRSQGKLVDISLFHICSDNLLHYIADSASHLQRLSLDCCYDITDEGLSEAVKKLPCLEEIDLTVGKLSKNSLEAIGRCCPLLKSLKFNWQSCGLAYDGDAFAIAQTIPNLRHLQLFRNGLTNVGLLAILDGCPLLESLDIRDCFRVYLGGSLRRRCFEQIKDFLEVEPGYQ